MSVLGDAFVPRRLRPGGEAQARRPPTHVVPVVLPGKDVVAAEATERLQRRVGGCRCRRRRRRPGQRNGAPVPRTLLVIVATADDVEQGQR
jgi:hypothetical protein